MKKKIIIVTSIILGLLLILLVFLFFWLSPKNDFSKIAEKSWNNYHAELEYNNEKISMEVNAEYSSIQYVNSTGTYVYILDGKDLVLFHVLENKTTDIFNFYKYDNEKPEDNDVSKIYDKMKFFLITSDYQEIWDNINITLTKESVGTIKSLINIISGTEIDTDALEEWECQYKISDDTIKEISCKENNSEIFKIAFSEFNSIDKSKLLKIKYGQVDYDKEDYVIQSND